MVAEYDYKGDGQKRYSMGVALDEELHPYSKWTRWMVKGPPTLYYQIQQSDLEFAIDYIRRNIFEWAVAMEAKGDLGAGRSLRARHVTGNGDLTSAPIQRSKTVNKIVTKFGDNARLSHSGITSSIDAPAAQPASNADRHEPLVAQLRLLREAMQQQAAVPQHHKDLAAVASAESEVSSGKTDAAELSLKSASKWVIDIAEKVGVPIAVAFLKNTMNI